MVDKITSPVPPLGLSEKINEIIDAKQDVLVSGVNIKTVNNTNLLGEGNVTISATISGLTSNRALVSDDNGGVGVSATTSTELGYLSGVTSAIQTQLNGKQASITGGASTITSSNLTASMALISNSSGKVAVSSVTSTELGYLSGVTSGIQTQLNAKFGAPNYGGSSDVTSSCYTASGTGYNPTKNGFLYFTSYQLASTSTLYVYSGSTLVFQKTLGGSPGYQTGYTMSSFIPANKSYSYRIYGGNANQSVIFIPCG